MEKMRLVYDWIATQPVFFQVFVGMVMFAAFVVLVVILVYAVTLLYYRCFPERYMDKLAKQYQDKGLM
jgi:hypothetical protein